MCDEPDPRTGHVAVRLDHYILMLEGISQAFGAHQQFLHMESRVIWIYNLYTVTEQWKMYMIPYRQIAPTARKCPSAVVINDAICMFGGWKKIEADNPTNDLFKLMRTPAGSFEWTKITTTNPITLKTPSPRFAHTAWEYDNKLWVFGGLGSLDEENLEEHGNFEIVLLDEIFCFANNQLLCFDPLSNQWTNPKCSGTVPAPRGGHAALLLQLSKIKSGCMETPCQEEHLMICLN